MGDRAFVIFKDRQGVSPTVYLHWDGSEVPTLLEKLEQFMASRRDDCEYACARFIGLCHQRHAESNLSLGVLNTNMKRYLTEEWEDYRSSPFDAFALRRHRRLRRLFLEGIRRVSRRTQRDRR